MTPELSDDDKAILAGLLRETIDRDRYPLSPRVRSYKAILAKLTPPTPRRAQHGADEEAAAVAAEKAGTPLEIGFDRNYLIGVVFADGRRVHHRC
jgi:hypothetical protein